MKKKLELKSLQHRKTPQVVIPDIEALAAEILDFTGGQSVVIANGPDGLEIVPHEYRDSPAVVNKTFENAPHEYRDQPSVEGIAPHEYRDSPMFEAVAPHEYRDSPFGYNAEILPHEYRDSGGFNVVPHEYRNAQ